MILYYIHSQNEKKHNLILPRISQLNSQNPQILVY
jgi:hypothetical protein